MGFFQSCHCLAQQLALDTTFPLPSSVSSSVVAKPLYKLQGYTGKRTSYDGPWPIPPQEGRARTQRFGVSPRPQN